MDHGYLDEDEEAAVLGERVQAMLKKLALVPPGMIAKTSFEVDGVEYEISLRKTK
ncbi:hypothetical protein [Sphingomonas paucimobilis]|uniref:Uncharacterized protein n=1 Tax=Sphingomonas paucimobilis TaxID=13689 RepID=A0A7T3E607_SPHPI|nr:hypothetical protein [Sphingomonas paucimobilis]QPT09703.1 hypothetical protein I6G38_05455 [Sphingomonas paucimobilis]